ncbi:uncharacterized protein VP01_761g4 [Puccinia sorghi]|uniref:Uncharacterized protein n=1 Tax=Puccinia sorghi TaxID=27349 RepID=A0A0L6UBW0_9BASI|nr:uncharacterized protein VP01_761g4 [Puccinia sorghi]
MYAGCFLSILQSNQRWILILILIFFFQFLSFPVGQITDSSQPWESVLYNTIKRFFPIPFNTHSLGLDDHERNKFVGIKACLDCRQSGQTTPSSISTQGSSLGQAVYRMIMRMMMKQVHAMTKPVFVVMVLGMMMGMEVRASCPSGETHACYNGGCTCLSYYLLFSPILFFPSSSSLLNIFDAFFFFFFGGVLFLVLFVRRHHRKRLSRRSYLLVLQRQPRPSLSLCPHPDHMREVRPWPRVSTKTQGPLSDLIISADDHGSFFFDVLLLRCLLPTQELYTRLACESKPVLLLAVHDRLATELQESFVLFMLSPPSPRATCRSCVLGPSLSPPTDKYSACVTGQVAAGARGTCWKVQKNGRTSECLFKIDERVEFPFLTRRVTLNTLQCDMILVENREKKRYYGKIFGLEVLVTVCPHVYIASRKKKKIQSPPPCQERGNFHAIIYHENEKEKVKRKNKSHRELKKVKPQALFIKKVYTFQTIFPDYVTSRNNLEIEFLRFSAVELTPPPPPPDPPPLFTALLLLLMSQENATHSHHKLCTNGGQQHISSFTRGPFNLHIAKAGPWVIPDSTKQSLGRTLWVYPRLGFLEITAPQKGRQCVQIALLNHPQTWFIYICNLCLRSPMTKAIACKLYNTQKNSPTRFSLSVADMIPNEQPKNSTLPPYEPGSQQSQHSQSNCKSWVWKYSLRQPKEEKVRCTEIMKKDGKPCSTQLLGDKSAST